MRATVCAGERYASKCAEAVALLRADRQDVDERQARADVGCLSFRICAEVCLVEHDDGNGARVADDGEIALEAAWVQIFGEGGDEKDRVDVRGDNLLFDGAAGGLARNRAAAIEAARDDRAVQARLRAATLIASARQACSDADPVADGWKIGGRARLVPEFSADLGPAIDITRDAIRPALFFDDADNEGRRNVVRDLLLKKLAPSKPSTLLHLLHPSHPTHPAPPPHPARLPRARRPSRCPSAARPCRRRR